MGELAEGAGERVVGLVVCVVLEVVALPDLVFAVAAVGFVVDEVDLSEEFFLVIFELADHFDDYMLVVSFEKGSGLAIAMR